MDTQIEFLKARIAAIADSLRLLQTKIEIYSATDRFAMEVHQTKYMELDRECLDLMTKLQELESVPQLNNTLSYPEVSNF
jgi:hypothetical protein